MPPCDAYRHGRTNRYCRLFGHGGRSKAKNFRNDGRGESSARSGRAYMREATLAKPARGGFSTRMVERRKMRRVDIAAGAQPPTRFAAPMRRSMRPNVRAVSERRARQSRCNRQIRSRRCSLSTGNRSTPRISAASPSSKAVRLLQIRTRRCSPRALSPSGDASRCLML